MSSQQNMPFLESSRFFPRNDPSELSRQMDQAYIDIANKVNSRTIGIYQTNAPSTTGEKWYLSGDGATKSQQVLHRVYEFTATGSIAHGINMSIVTYITSTYGSFTDGTNQYGCTFASNTTIAGQVTFYLTSTDIVIQSGAGAPTITKGMIVISWLSQY